MRKHVKGFTLIELMVVIAIIAILVGILIPALGAAQRAAKKVKDKTQIKSIMTAMFGWAAKNKVNNYPPATYDSTNNVWVYGGDALDEFLALLNDSADRLAAATLVGPMSKGYTPASITTATNQYDYWGVGYYKCSYGVLNGWYLNNVGVGGTIHGTSGGNNEGRVANNRAQVPLVDNALLENWNNGHAISDYMQGQTYPPTLTAADWQGHIGWSDGHVTYSQTSKVQTVMNGVTYITDDINALSAGPGPNTDAVMGTWTTSGAGLANSSGSPGYTAY